MTAQPLDMLNLVLTGVALVLVIEGIVYAVFPEGVKKLLMRVREVPAGYLRTGGLVAAVIGLALLWAVRH